MCSPGLTIFETLKTAKPLILFQRRRKCKNNVIFEGYTNNVTLIASLTLLFYIRHQLQKSAIIDHFFEQEACGN